MAYGRRTALPKPRERDNIPGQTVKKVDLCLPDGTATTVPIKLDTDHWTFYTGYKGQVLSGDDPFDLIARVKALVAGTIAVEWQPLLLATINHGLGLTVERLYYSRFPDGKLRFVSWDTPPEGRVLAAREAYMSWDERRDGPLTPPARVEDSYGRPRFVLPYDAATFARLLAYDQARVEAEQWLIHWLAEGEPAERLAALDWAMIVRLSAGEAEAQASPDGGA
jgi:hypothetical protein